MQRSDSAPSSPAPSSGGDDDDWLGDNDTPLEGFHWRGGADRDTTGMLLWSEPFIVDMPDKSQVGFTLNIWLNKLLCGYIIDYILYNNVVGYIS